MLVEMEHQQRQQQREDEQSMKGTFTFHVEQIM